MTILTRSAVVLWALGCLTATSFAQPRRPRGPQERRGPMQNTPRPGPMGPHHRFRERPYVSHFTPTLARPGERVEIRGENLPADARIHIGGVAVIPLRRTSTTIEFVVPPGVRNGQITLVSNSLAQPLFVGQLDLRRGGDLAAERARMRRDERRDAERAWKRRGYGPGMTRAASASESCAVATALHFWPRHRCRLSWSYMPTGSPVSSECCALRSTEPMQTSACASSPL